MESHTFLQNFSAVRTVYAEKLKKLKDASKPGAVVQAPPPVGKYSNAPYTF
jgi:hypothetical protein